MMNGEDFNHLFSDSINDDVRSTGNHDLAGWRNLSRPAGIGHTRNPVYRIRNSSGDSGGGIRIICCDEIEDFLKMFRRRRHPPDFHAVFRFFS